MHHGLITCRPNEYTNKALTQEPDLPSRRSAPLPLASISDAADTNGSEELDQPTLSKLSTPCPLALLQAPTHRCRRLHASGTLLDAASGSPLRSSAPSMHRPSSKALLPTSPPPRSLSGSLFVDVLGVQNMHVELPTHTTPSPQLTPPPAQVAFRIPTRLGTRFSPPYLLGHALVSPRDTRPADTAVPMERGRRS